MKTDSAGDVPDEGNSSIERAHLRESGDTSHTMFRCNPPPEFSGFLRRFWIPVWSVPAGHVAPQEVLQYPICLIVVTAGCA